MKSNTFCFREILLVAILLAGNTMSAQVSNSIKVNNTMNKIQSNKELITELYESVLNNRKLDRLPMVISEAYIGANDTKGVNGFKQPVMAVINAMPDAQWKIKELVADENSVVVRWELSGINSNPFQNFPATGKLVKSEGMGFFDISEGKVTGSRVMTDRIGVLQQLGVLPNDLSSLSITKNNVVFIDRFLVPAQGFEEFGKRVEINRKMISAMPGFVKDTAYDRKDENGNVVFITVAVWKDNQALQSAKAAIQELYKKEGFNPETMMERLHITMDRGVYGASGLE
jgi:steroid delta-isomerase-like uncharacterized protein